MLLTEEEIAYLIDTAQGRRDLVNKTIAAYEAKLREQEPEWQNAVQAAFGGIVQTPQG